MNHLAHLALAHTPGEDPGLLIGGFLGDHVKGRLKGSYAAPIERGIRLHRAIDAYTDSHDTVRDSLRRFPPELRRFSGIIVDIVYDHVLARHWHHYYNKPLHLFSTEVLAKLVEHAHLMPPVAASTAERMHAHNSLAGYTDPVFIDRSLTYLGTRLTRDNPLGEAFDTCERLLPELTHDFTLFYPQLIDFCDEWRNNQ